MYATQVRPFSSSWSTMVRPLNQCGIIDGVVGLLRRHERVLRAVARVGNELLDLAGDARAGVAVVEDALEVAGDRPRGSSAGWDA